MNRIPKTSRQRVTKDPYKVSEEEKEAIAEGTVRTILLASAGAVIAYHQAGSRLMEML